MSRLIDSQQNSSSQLTTFYESNKTEPFWLSASLDDSLYGTSHNPMNMDIDSMLAQGYDFEAAADQSIDWAQWDAWLSEQNVAHIDDGSASSTTFK